MKTYIKPCRWGQFLLIQGDLISEYANLYGEWCEGEVDLFKRLLPADGVVIEVGSNIGTHSVALSQLCHKGQVFCYEPQRVVFQVLCANIALNNRLNVFAQQCAVGAQAQTLDIQSSDYDQPWNYGAFSLAAGFSTEFAFPGTARLEKVNVVALDHDPQLQGLTRLDLLKIDAEGFEPQVLQGARQTIAKFKPYLFIENNDERHFDTLLAQICALGYVCCWYCSARYRPSNHNRAFWQQEGFDINLLCVPSGKVPPPELLVANGFRDLRELSIQLY